MENASKALIIIAGVLITMIMVSILTFGAMKWKNLRKSQEDAREMERVNDYNRELLSYNKSALRGSDFLSLINLVEDLNEKTEHSGIDLEANKNIPNASRSDDDFIKIYINFPKNSNANLPAGLKFDKETNIPGLNLSGKIYYINNLNEQLRNIEKTNKKAKEEIQLELGQQYYKCIKVEYNSRTHKINRMYFQLRKVRQEDNNKYISW